jgi:membrane protease YdiL (CAAX protease family)
MQALARATSNALRQRGQPLPNALSADQLARINVLVSIGLAFSFGLLFNMIFTFGEEFGWRGYLLPRLAPLGDISATLITGVLWGFWHAPLILLDDYNYPGHPWLGILTMVVFTTSLGAVFAWLRFRSGSVWPSTLAHAAINAQAGLAALVLSRGDSLLRAPIGLLGLIPLILFAVFLAVTGRLRVQGSRTLPVEASAVPAPGPEAGTAAWSE